MTQVWSLRASSWVGLGGSEPQKSEPDGLLLVGTQGMADGTSDLPPCLTWLHSLPVAMTLIDIVKLPTLSGTLESHLLAVNHHHQKNHPVPLAVPDKPVLNEGGLTGGG